MKVLILTYVMATFFVLKCQANCSVECLDCNNMDCERCSEGFKLFLNGVDGNVICIGEKVECSEKLKRLGSNKTELEICVASQIDNTAMIFICVGVGGIIVCGFIVYIIVNKIISKIKNPYRALENSRFIPHDRCSFCESKEGLTEIIEQVDKKLNCGGVLCSKCIAPAKLNLKTGCYSNCKVCGKLAIWYISSPKKVDQDSEILPSEVEKLNIAQDEPCVICFKKFPDSIIPCGSNHMLHANCLADLYRSHYYSDSSNRSILQCPICRRTLKK